MLHWAWNRTFILCCVVGMACHNYAGIPSDDDSLGRQTDRQTVAEKEP